MTTIAAENRKTLRKAMQVRCDFLETTDEPTSLTPENTDAAYNGVSNMGLSRQFTALMELSENGFLNDGIAAPMQTDSESYRYGYVTETAKANGTFPKTTSITIGSSTEWEQITLQLRHANGDTETRVYDDLTWNNGTTQIIISDWTPGERAYITDVLLGKHWIWNNDSILSATLDLHAVSTQLGGELEVSSIELEIYEPEDRTDVLGFIPEGAPIWYSAGYDGDMSAARAFYMSEPATWENNVLTIKGQDATMFLENQETPARIGSYYGYAENGQQSARVIVARLREALDAVEFSEVGSVSTIGTSTPAYWYFEAKAPRSIISEFCDLFRETEYIAPTYVDAGIPTLYLNDATTNTWTIYADEISEMSVQVEHNVNRATGTLETYSYTASSKVAEQDAKAGETVIIDLDNPASAAYASPTPTSEELLSPTTFKFKAASAGTYSIYADQYKASTSSYSTTDSSKGITYDIGDEMSFPVSIGFLTRRAMRDILDRSNILYEFTHRGNPHIQPRDVLNVQIATWADVLETIDGLWPETDLYPTNDLYPDATYKEARRMQTKWVTMTVDTITFEHGEGGSLISKIKARKGAV